MSITLEKISSGATATGYRDNAYTNSVLDKNYPMPVVSDSEPVNCEIRNGRMKSFKTMQELVDELDS